MALQNKQLIGVCLTLVCFLIAAGAAPGSGSAQETRRNSGNVKSTRAIGEVSPLPPTTTLPQPGQPYTGVQAYIMSRLTISGETAKKDRSAVLRERFYRERQYLPAWTQNGKISDQAPKLLSVLKEAYREGLNPEDYGIDRLEALLSDVSRRSWPAGNVSPETWAELDLLLTNGFFLYGTHVSEGRLDPAKWFYQWVPYRRSLDLVPLLKEALDGRDVEGALRSLPPRYPAYAQLRTELAKYRQIAAQGGWEPIPEHPKLHRGSVGQAVTLLKKRLIIAGDLEPSALQEGNQFNRQVEEALQRFQQRHGLRATGAIEGETRKALNLSVEKRIRQIEWNLERWRWLPDELGPRYILVNIPDFRLFVVENQITVMSMKTVVGRAQQPTPVFMDNMSYLELNPTWNLPNSIVSDEMIPKVKANPDFLTKKRIRIYRNWSPTAKEIDPKTIDWAKMDPKKFPYRMIQDPGVNPLGRIKFMFPNQFDVYLHDTTQKYLFQRSRRMYSHGCIRVEKPYELGEWVLKDDPSWTKERLIKEIKKGKRQQVNLPKPIPVYVIYLTAWFDTRGHIHFRDDIYDYDKNLEKALEKSSGTAGRL